jgi:[glutamine synthetase] adenylyltransferase / [glutamine synthetase]-adenylyl-L-tyrosine phosphorylase
MRVQVTDETVARLLAQLPEPHTAQLLYDRLSQNPSIRSLFQRDPALLSDVLTLAAWSPLLATTIENYPDYVSWLQRERKTTRVRTREELGEALGRFALINSQLDPHVMLARFRRRELLRTYLHDIRRTRTVVETTEELSSLADATLEYALKLARQDLDNRYGAPQVVDSQGRISSAEFCIVALGKLGSYELNYASDIDLLFLFSEAGMTAAGGSRGQVSNREYFVKVGERLLRLVSEQTGEGASYRIDMRLRPHGRDGALACSLDEAVRYYRQSAQDWELQTLIRSRASAGSPSLYANFAKLIIDRVFRRNIGVGDALANVRLSKEKIDLQRERDEKGFNVKLGRGGIREIEFIAQALQVAFGGNYPWLRAPHTLISLSRLTDRELIHESEHWQLSDAYNFLRALEHRLQMEHGLQTHSVPNDIPRRELVARRMNFTGSDALAQFDVALNTHTDNVHAVFLRVFGSRDESARQPPVPRAALVDDVAVDPNSASIRFAAGVFARHGDSDSEKVYEILRAEADRSLNPRRALSFVTRVAGSLEKDTRLLSFSEGELRALVRVCGVSEFFGELLAGNPSLIKVLPGENDLGQTQIDLRELVSSDPHQTTFAESLDALRHGWSRWFVEIGARDAQDLVKIEQVNHRLNALAVSSLDASLLIARQELERRYGKLAAEPRVAVFGLGRLGSGGMDYGSDLDVIVVYDAAAPSPVAELTHEAAYSRLTEFLVTGLSSITREGYLYRIDLRLRPDGQKGPLASGSRSFLSYLRTRASIWEWLAYVKLRAVAGDKKFGQALESSARETVHELARQIDPAQLRTEAHRVRNRLEKEKASRRAGINIKHGAGGMLDVYFATRYLQLRDNVMDHGEDRTTLRMLQSLRERAAISQEDHQTLSEGYNLLRAVDHQLRLIVGRSATLPAPEQPAFADIVRRLNFKTLDELATVLLARMKEIRITYERIMQGEATQNGNQ